MSQDILIAGKTYSGVPSVKIPKQLGGFADFVDTSDADALASEIASGKTAYVNGEKLTGTGGGAMQNKTVTLGASAPSNVNPDSGYSGLNSVAMQIDSSVVNAQNIADGVTILGVTGAASVAEPIEISTDAGMAAVLIAANVGKCYKFTGTTGTYTNGDLYIVEENT